MFTKIRSRMQGEGGFTLIELLVVIIIIAILAAIAIPTFLGQQQKAKDAAAKSLVRNAMTAVESQYVDSKTFLKATVQVDAKLIEPSINFDGSGEPITPGGLAKDARVTIDGIDDTWYSVGTKSASGNTFWVVARKISTTADPAGTVFWRQIGDALAVSGW